MLLEVEKEMAVNKNIWETLDTFTINNATYERSKQISSLFSDGKLVLNSDFDKSIYMWDREPIVYNGYRLGDDGKPYIDRKGVDSRTAVTLATGYAGYFPVGFPNSYEKTALTYAMRPNQKEATRPQYGNVITNFDYKTIVFCIYVLASTNEFDTQMRAIPLKQYFDNSYTQYPYIRGVVARSFCGENKNRKSSGQIVASTYTNFSYQDFHDKTETVYLSSPIVWTHTGTGSKSTQMLLYGAIASIPAGADITARIDIKKYTNYYNGGYYNVIGNPEKYTLKQEDPQYNQYYIQFNLTYDEILKEALKWGFMVTDNETSAKTGDIFSDENIFIPTISPSGNVTNDYTHGTSNQSQPQMTWKNPWDDSGYDPNDPNKYTDKIELTKPGLTTTGIFNRTFALTASDVDNLADYLWNADETIFTEVVKGLALMGGNPIDGMIDLRLYPFDCAAKAGGGHSETIVVGRTDTKVNALKINSYNAVLELGSCTFHRKFVNFLDYEPFTTASLYIPYVGIVPISTADFMGQTISCKMVVDITTGSCTAIVFANDIPIIYKNGNIGVEIPMTGTNSAEYASRIAGGLTSGATDIALGAASKSVGQVVSGVGAIADSALSVNNTMYNTAGSSSPACGLWQPQNCYFIIQRPVPIVPGNYGHTVGYACNYQAKISECSGYTQTYNVDVSSINAPESEKNAIAEILNSGFYA